MTAQPGPPPPAPDVPAPSGPGGSQTLILDLGPVLVFFAVNFIAGPIWATAALMAATLIAVSYARLVQQHWPRMLLITAAMVMVFGGITIWLNDESYIQIKASLIWLLFAALLIGGSLLDRPLLRPLLRHALKLDDRGWLILSLRFGLFFLAMAGLNELVRHSVSFDWWVTFKTFAPMVLIVGFLLLQAPLLARHQLSAEDGTAAE